MGMPTRNIFISLLRIKKRANTIVGLFDEAGRWCHTDQQLERVVLQYFEGLFKSSEPQNFEEVMETIPCVISDEVNAMLIREVEKDEVFRARS